MCISFLIHKVWELSSVVSLIFSSNQIFESLKVFLILPGEENKAFFLQSDFKVEPEFCIAAEFILTVE